MLPYQSAAFILLFYHVSVDDTTTTEIYCQLGNAEVMTARACYVFPKREPLGMLLLTIPSTQISLSSLNPTFCLIEIIELHLAASIP